MFLIIFLFYFKFFIVYSQGKITPLPKKIPFEKRQFFQNYIFQIFVENFDHLCFTLRSGLHEIPTMIRTFPRGLENSHACKWNSDNFPGITHWKIVSNPFACMVVLQSMGEGLFFFLKVWDRFVPQILYSLGPFLVDWRKTMHAIGFLTIFQE